MTEAGAPAAAGRVPWHFWVVAVLALLAAAVSAYDYLMTQTENVAYLAMFTPEQQVYFTTLPLWQEIVWAFAVWAGVLAAILLVIRLAWAVWLFALSFLCSLVFMAACLADPTMRAMMTEPVTLLFTVVVLGFALFVVLYAAAMKKRGVLR